MLVSPVMGQGAGPKPRPTQGPIGVRSESTESADGGDLESLDGLKARMKGNSAQPRSRAPKGHCRFELSIKPEKLLPGQSGKGTVLMIFQGDAVLEEAARFQLESLQTQSLLSVGPMSRLPASLSTVAEAYRGRAVYDNWAIMEFPISMSPDAPLGSKQLHTLKASFELHDGNSGQSLGDFEQRIAFACEVGVKPDPFVQGLAAKAKDGGDSVANSAAATRGDAVPVATASTPVVPDMAVGHVPATVAVDQTVAVQDPEGASPGSLPLTPGAVVGNKMGVLTYLGIFCGVGLAVVLLMVFLRRSP